MHPSRRYVARNGWLAAVVLALSLAPVAGASAGTVVIQPSSQDAFIMKNARNRITGATNDRIRVQGSPRGSAIWRGLVQFPLGSIPSGSTVTAAVVDLYAGVNARNPALTHGLFRITAPWRENETKWTNQPPTATAPSATAVVGGGRGFKSFDVTLDVQSAVNSCSEDNGWVIKDVAETASDDRVSYVAQGEIHPTDIGNRPRLTVTFTPPACVTDADCQDTNLCTTQEHCQAGLCVTTAVSCDDGNPCTVDVCDCGQGCVAQPICNDGLSCTTDVCNPSTLECTNTPVDSVCVTECSTGTCLGDPDSPLIEPDTGCVIETKAPAGKPCSDGEPCTTPDQCNGQGQCTPGPKDCGTPTCGASPVCSEQCDNCIDDNGNGLVDRNDPQCAPRADGGAQGTGDPKFRGKPVVRCQKAIRAAGGRFANQLRARLQKCTDSVFQCLQQKPGDAVCLAKAEARCSKQTVVLEGGPSNLELRLGAKIAKACGPKKPGFLPLVSGADLCGAKGLGFGSELPQCQTPQSAALLAAVTSAIAEEHRCRTVQLFAADVPRATELLTAGGVDLTALPCMSSGAQGGNLGLGKPSSVVKAVVGCQRGIGTAGARFASQILGAEQRCSEAVALCIQTKPGNAKCLTNARKMCTRVTSQLFNGPKSRAARLRTAIAHSCGSTKAGKAPRVALGDLQSLLGVGYDALSGVCKGFGITGLSSLDDISNCLVRQHVCRADQLLTNQTPRAHELLTIGGAVQP